MYFTAVGDVLCQRRMAEDYDGFSELKEFITKGDARFFNLETTVNREGECFGNQFSGGTYMRCDPLVMGDMLKFGFNMTSFNNNHVMDFGHEGLVRTLENVTESGIVHAGVGMNLHAASEPAYLDTKNGRVALVAVNTSFEPASMAGEQSKRIKGRPGINGIRISQKIVLPKEDFERIKMIGDRCGINASKMVTRREGYFPFLPDGLAELGELQFVCGEEYGLLCEPNPRDLERVKRAIGEAAMKADYVMVSLHSHQMDGEDKTAVPPFLVELAHSFVDAGADAVIGHGPHLLRALEVYRQKPIFYSLGDFVLQLYDVPIAPEDFYQKYGMTSESSVIELLEKRSAGFTRGLMADARMLESVIPYWETDRDKNLTKLVMLPVRISCGEGKMLEGLPRPARDPSFIENFAKLSKPFGVDMEFEDGLICCKWSQA